MFASSEYVSPGPFDEIELIFAYPGLTELYTPSKTTNYAAPEILLGRPYQAAPAEIWALGVLLYLLLTGEMPFASIDHAVKGMFMECNSRAGHAIRSAHTEGLRWLMPFGTRRLQGWITRPRVNITREAYSVIRHCLEVDLDKRWDVYDLVRDEWMQRSTYWPSNMIYPNQSPSSL